MHETHSHVNTLDPIAIESASQNVNSIEVLPTEVINQIAAGEVIERPSHMVKELVENALDAKATAVEIFLWDGGRSVRIKDNGVGIPSNELPKAIDRFGTSKIRRANDLWHLSTFGFRGEALASIASVSEFSIVSRLHSKKNGFELRSKFGEITGPFPIAAEPGTTIEIRDLFANTPARLKFLKSPTAEISAIKATIRAVALAFESVEFRVFVDGNPSMLLPRSSKIERVQRLLDEKEIYFTSHVTSESTFCIDAYFSSPFAVQKTSRQIYLFAQNRWIQDRTLQAAIMESYRNLLMHGEYPTVALFIQVPTDEIDVNIHPTKSQVRFQNSSLLFRTVSGALKGALEKAPWRPAPQHQPLALDSADNSWEGSVIQQAYDSGGSGPSIVSGSILPSLGSNHNEPLQNSFILEGMTRTQFKQKTESPISASKSLWPDTSSVPVQGREYSWASIQRGQNGFWTSMQVLGQSNLTYILAQSSDALYLVDQHAAHERYNFELILQSWDCKPLPKQTTLFPLLVSVSADRVEALMTQTSDLQRLGIDIEQLSPTEIAVSQWPNAFSEKAVSQIIQKTAEEAFLLGHSFRFENTLREKAATLACHSSVRAGQALSTSEMQNLLTQIDEFPLSTFCPHGRPVYVKYSFTNLEKEFGRRV